MQTTLRSIAIVALLAIKVAAQTIALPTPDPANAAAGAKTGSDSLVELNISGTVPLPQLVQVIGQQSQIKFLYGSDLANRRVTVFTPTKLPASALPILLGSILKAENLAVVDSDVPGFKRIIDFKEMPKHSAPGDAAEILRRDGPAAAVTQVVAVDNVDTAALASQLKPFLSAGNNIITLPQAKLLILTDYAENVRTVVRLLEIIDQPVDRGVIEFYQTTRRPAQVLIDQVESLLATKDAKSPADFRLFNDASGGRVIVAGSRARVSELTELLRRLDTGTNFETKLYKLQNVSASRIESLATQIAGRPSQRQRSRDDAIAEPAIETTVDEEGNLLIVRASPEIHVQIRRLVEQLDVPVGADESPIRFYKLKNASANEVLLSLLSLQQATGVPAGGFGASGFGLGGVVPANYNAAGIGGFGVGGVGLPGVVPINGLNNAGFGSPINPAVAGGGLGLNSAATQPNNNAQNLRSLNPQSSAGANLNRGVAAAGGNLALAGNLGIGGVGQGGGVASLPGDAKISADVATNSLIVVAPANVQPLYERLIASLDQRRPQVLIRADIVAIDTSNNFQLGVEVVGGDRTGSNRLFAFSQFGLSQVDPLTGVVTGIDNSLLGFNGVLLDPEVADVIVQALSTNTRSRVLASPKVLVNDNETGTLESVTSIPFSTIGFGETASVQTLGGDQTAGTTISLTPQINENDFLKLAFEVEFSTFGTGGSATLPPPRQIDRVGSVVTVPDGQTVVVGGLQRFSENDSFSGIPILERIPILRELSSRSTATKSTMSFFLFIRPTILRDSGFRDLEFLSDVDLAAASLPGDEPESRPMVVDSTCPPPPVQTIVQGDALMDCESTEGIAIQPMIDVSAPSIYSEQLYFDEPASQPIMIEID